MKTITISDLRQRWPAIEKTLNVENEILITRDGQPVARLVRVVKQPRPSKRWDPQAHMRWLKKVWGNRMMVSSDQSIAADRADRWEHLES